MAISNKVTFNSRMYQNGPLFRNFYYSRLPRVWIVARDSGTQTFEKYDIRRISRIIPSEPLCILCKLASTCQLFRLRCFLPYVCLRYYMHLIRDPALFKNSARLHVDAICRDCEVLYYPRSLQFWPKRPHKHKDLTVSRAQYKGIPESMLCRILMLMWFFGILPMQGQRHPHGS